MRNLLFLTNWQSFLSLFLCLIFSVVFMSISSLMFSCLFFSSYFPFVPHYWFFIHSCTFLVSCLKFVIQTSIPYIYPTTVPLFGYYINPHSPCPPHNPGAFCCPPPPPPAPQWPLHPVRGFCCRITLSLLRSELCSPPITMTGEVTVMRSYLTSPSTHIRCHCPTSSQHFLSPRDQQLSNSWNKISNTVLTFYTFNE